MGNRKFYICKKTHIIEFEDNENILNLNNLNSQFSSNSIRIPKKLFKFLCLLTDDANLENGIYSEKIQKKFNCSSRSVDDYQKRLNEIFQKELKNDSYEIIFKPRRALFKFSGEKYKDTQLFTIFDFFDVFLSEINNIYFKNEPLKIGNLTSVQKEEIFFGLFGDNIAPNCKETLCDLYRTANKFIKDNSVEYVFSKKRKKLKQLLIANDVFSSDLKQEDDAEGPLKKAIQEFNEESINNWENVSENIFPIGKKYYSYYKNCIIEKILSPEYETHIKISWVEPIKEYDFSSMEQSEKESLDIDDLIVSFAFVALSNYKIENESLALQFERTSYLETIKLLFEKRFSPTTYSEDGENDRDVKEMLTKCAEIAVEKRMPIEQIMEIAVTTIRKTYDNKNEYDNENNNDYTKKL